MNDELKNILITAFIVLCFGAFFWGALILFAF
jgi:hypothetical protein